MRNCVRVVAVLLSLAPFGVTTATAVAGDWPQFRGPNAIGKPTNAATTESCPVEISPKQHVLWKTPLAPGHSSPVVSGDRIYLTATEKNELLTISIDRTTGRVLWSVPAAHDKLETVHRTGSPAQSTPATDGERVVSFFGSCGLQCYDRNGKPLWRTPMGPFPNDFGAGSSPLIVGERVILCQDHDDGSALYAFDKRTGNQIWKTERSDFHRNFSTPVIWEINGKKQIVVAGSLRVVAYDFETGKEIWTVRGIARMICATPVLGGNNHLYVSGWANGGDSGSLIRYEPFEAYAAAHDADKDGLLGQKELPDDEVRKRFAQIDRDKNGRLSRAEYDFMRNLFETGKNVVMSIRPGGTGDCTETHIAWTYPKLVPFCASPLYHDDRIFTVKDGGILSCLNAENGKPFKQGRIPASGNYYSSPVTDGRHVYLIDERGQLTVVTASEKWEVVHSAEFNDKVYATPALVDGRIYLRTNGFLYCFGK